MKRQSLALAVHEQESSESETVTLSFLHHFSFLKVSLSWCLKGHKTIKGNKIDLFILGM